MPLDHKNKNGEFFPNFEFFWNKKEWVIIFSTNVYSLNLWVDPVDVLCAELDHVGLVTVGKDLEMLFTFTRSREVVSFLDGTVTIKKKEKPSMDIFSHPRLAAPLAAFESSMREKAKIEEDIGSLASWSHADGNFSFTEYTKPDVVEHLKRYLLAVDKDKDKKDMYFAYHKISEEAEAEIKKIFKELTQ